MQEIVILVKESRKGLGALSSKIDVSWKKKHVDA